ncbi:hypothetical protein GCM10007874_08930 [Labrys miyagiensis]|uniref:Uncharacterized protein n=1 Tax=Labrys miyagiensis TaxID=346912 RepID=A0ABQ6CHW2_9HYPH|nr:hypothetical protein [Labrys miyagiensis]GLS17877.1 hypothetical protein GCM10007874_08930 [Labrys miyagiensis]
MTTPSLLATWTGQAFTPSPRATAASAGLFDVGQRYRVAVVAERSKRAHKAYFAALHAAFAALPEGRFHSVEQLRKTALCATGFCNEIRIACASRAEALRTVAGIAALDPHALCTVRERTVVVRTAHSQSRRAMGRERFEASRKAVLDYVAGL